MAVRRRNLTPDTSAGPDVPTLADVGKGAQVHVQDTVTKLAAHYEDEDDTKVRLKKSKEIAQEYFTIVTDFMEYGYGKSFHLAPIFDDSSLAKCILDYEKGFATSLGARPGMKLLDIGCGVGGPACAIAKLSGAHITGINASEYQLKRARIHTENEQLQDLCDYVLGDFSNMDCFEDNAFDGAYCFEAVCYAEDLVTVFKEIYRVIKPGALYVNCDWCLTDKYDANNPEHVKIKEGICMGGALPTLWTITEYTQAMQAAGFEMVEVKEAHKEGDLPWYTYLSGKGCMSLQSFRASTCGRIFTHSLLTVLECIRVAPRGATQMHSMLCIMADNLIASGKLDIMSPCTRTVAKKPL